MNRPAPITYVLVVATLLAGLTACGGKAPSPTSTSIAHCSRNPCTDAGAIRWTAPVGTQLVASSSLPVLYRNAVGYQPLLASANSTMVLAIQRSVRAFDASTGAVRWIAPDDLIPPDMVADRLTPIGSYIDLSVMPRSATGVGQDLLLDPATGHVIAQVPALEAEGIAWADASSIVAIEPTALVRLTIGQSTPVWSVPITRTIPNDKQSSPHATVGIAHDQIWVSGVEDVKLLELSTGQPAVVPSELAGLSLVYSASTHLVLSGQTGVGLTFYDAAQGKVLARLSDMFVRAIDIQRGVIYVAPENGERELTGYSLSTGERQPKPSTPLEYYIPPATGVFSVIAVRDGTAILQSDDEDERGATTTFVGRDALTGRLRWTSAGLRNYFPIVGFVRLAYGSSDVAGITCADAGLGTGEHPCADPRLTVVNTGG
jgi:hypothetical protein